VFENVPGWHGIHALDPVLEYVPAVHTSQALIEPLLVKVPGVHCWHCVELYSIKYVPAPQHTPLPTPKHLLVWLPVQAGVVAHGAHVSSCDRFRGFSML
jgi:hypothetical protein